MACRVLDELAGSWQARLTSPGVPSKLFEATSLRFKRACAPTCAYVNICVSMQICVHVYVCMIPRGTERERERERERGGQIIFLSMIENF